ncbi:hypothetical protein [Flavisphingomonas formosensis]|uniref:hypothetical protein n=1 Tax=Flavisphingomonas formosensis TaxID=861534 RepID=UPI0012F820D3|nr:hypothetical protein [Sphingomonas formosensis]
MRISFSSPAVIDAHSVIEREPAFGNFAARWPSQARGGRNLGADAIKKGRTENPAALLFP